MAIQISGTTVIDNSRNLVNIANASTSATANTYVIRDASGKISATNVGTTITSGTALGTTIEGGNLICKSGSIAMIVSPISSQVQRNWYCVDDAIIRAGVVSCCLGWFIPTCGQLQNPGYTCRTYWDSYCCNFYWTTTMCGDYPSGSHFIVNFCTGTAQAGSDSSGYFVRAFRCVTY